MSKGPSPEETTYSYTQVSGLWPPPGYVAGKDTAVSSRRLAAILRLWVILGSNSNTDVDFYTL